MRKQIKIFIIRDNSIFYNGLKNFLNGNEEFEILGTTSPETYLQGEIKLEAVDVLILDLDAANHNGLQLIDLLLETQPKMSILAFSSSSSPNLIYETLTKGAKSFLPKSCKEEEILMALFELTEGGSYLSEICSKQLVQFLSNQRQRQLDKMALLTKREIEILSLVAKGLTNYKIGNLLSISPRTVGTHRRNIMEKLNLNNAVELANYLLN